MTYALAWKNNNELFMAADTAITTSDFSPKDIGIRRTSFNRESFIDITENRKVEERVIKLFLKQNVGLNFAGDYRTANEIAKSFYSALEKGTSHLSSLNYALFVNRISDDRHVQISVGYYDVNGPHILHFDSATGPEIREVNRIQMGNPPPELKERTSHWLDSFEEQGVNGQWQFVATIGILQSYSLLNNTIPMGIGGVFTGLMINQTGATWQPDILHIEYGGQNGIHVGTCFRHDCLVINSPVVGQSRCFSGTLLPITSPIVHNRVWRAVAKGKRIHQNHAYQYVIILSHENNALVIIEMKRNAKHAVIWFKEFVENDRTGTQVSFFPGLRKLLKEEGTGLKLIKYVAPTTKEIPADKIIRTEIDYDRRE